MRYRPQIFFFFIFLVFLYAVIYYSGIHVTKPFEYEHIAGQTFSKESTKLNVSQLKYPHLLDCSTFYTSPQLDNYSAPADVKLHELRIVRGILLYYPSNNYQYFEQEIKWVYRSWTEMQKYEPKLWRTDLIIFANMYKIGFNYSLFNDLECLTTNRRQSKTDKPMCTVINYVAIKDRILLEKLDQSETVQQIYDHLYKKINIFDEPIEHFSKFYLKLKELTSYEYLDSILMAFDGYSYFKNNFDFVLRSDMDIFLTPLFAQWLPLKCNEFIVGGGGYSHDFNMKRLRRIAAGLGLEYADVRNLGSTWYSTPAQFRLVAYYTLVSMVYISSEEFSEPERQGKVGTILWPEWHYGVLLLYGQNLAMNHLIATNQINITKLEKLIDYPSSNEESVFNKVHIHVFHGADMFSKFMFRDGKYNNYTTNDLAKLDKTKIKYYTLNIAMESKLLTPADQNKLMKVAIMKKE